jgi:ribosomal protein S18 acetylase RimI-like enzyme
MKIRKVTAKDFEEFFNLEKEFHELEKKLGKKDELIRLYKSPTKNKQKKRFNKWLRRKNSLFIVAEEKNKMIGYLYGYLEPIFSSKTKTGYIEDLIISKKFRKKGIATKLHNKFIKWLNKKRIKWITLDVSWVNKTARKTYEKWRYKNKKVKMVKKLK